MKKVKVHFGPEDNCHTWQGHVFDVDNIGNLIVDVEDIAHSLSINNRWNGHLNVPFSVAQHSVIVEAIMRGVIETRPSFRMLDEMGLLIVRLCALFHDASEAYLPDMPSPIKRKLPEYKKLEREVLAHIFKELDLPFPYPFADIIKSVDTEIRSSEAISMSNWDCSELVDVFKLNIVPMSPEQAENAFLFCYEQIIHDMNNLMEYKQESKYEW